MAESDPIRVLLVDDDPVIVEVWSLVLSQDPRFHVVTSAGSGQDAIQAVQSESPDVVILDYLLPGINGVDAAHAMKQLQPDLDIVMVTGHDEEDDEFNHLSRLKSEGQIAAVIPKGNLSLERLEEALGLLGMPNATGGW